MLQLINAYRVRGHLIADLDPLGTEPQYHPELDPEYYDLTMWDLDREFATGGILGGASSRDTLREILETVRATYCGRIGVEYMNIQDPAQKTWLQDRMEPTKNSEDLGDDLKKRLLTKLIYSEAFEKFLHGRFVGHKRFSLEGGETLIPLLDQLLEQAGVAGVQEMVLGMSHRGRLNVVTQTIGKAYHRIFAEFQGNPDPDAPQGSGDVKYHLGASGVHRAANGSEVRITLSPNPSHLEAVNPVVEGIARAKQDQIGGDPGRQAILPVLIHGDAAFAGQGVVAETLNLSQLRGYRTGGTVHIIVNNQIGFTTPVDSARSSPYPTDVAKMCQAPIFHVNGDDPEAAARVVRLAFEFRQRFQSDVVIDMFCYRRHGHNEGDEPSFTQPIMYTKIDKHPSTAAIYSQALVKSGLVTQDEIEELRGKAKQLLESSFEEAGKKDQPLKAAPLGEPIDGPPVPRPTKVQKSILETIVGVMMSPPEGVDVHPKLVKFLEQRKRAMENGEGVDWALAEALAFGSLVFEGVPVRLSGEDSARGTFSQRHMVLHDDDTEQHWCSLQHVSPEQAKFWVIDSPLSEEAVLGFEYGYSIGDPTALVLWEAQFGDFINEAQVVIDQFLAGGESKWGQPSSVVLLLPHGYEGQGPEHSSARLERFLQVAAEDNIVVANCTTPAQYFHLLRRQKCEGIHKPLIVMTPKSLLRHPSATSSVDELTSGIFQRVLDDESADPAKVDRLVLCSGKVFYDLDKKRREMGLENAAIVRVEQLYPNPVEELRALMVKYRPRAMVWCQEEPRNMGAWMQLSHLLFELAEGTPVHYAGRPESASTATGYLKVHLEEQAALVRTALESSNP